MYIKVRTFSKVFFLHIILNLKYNYACIFNVIIYVDFKHIRLNKRISLTSENVHQAYITDFVFIVF